MNRYFTYSGTQMANKHMKRCSASLAIRKCRLKKNDVALVLLQLAKVKPSVNTKSSKPVNKLDHLGIAG